VDELVRGELLGELSGARGDVFVRGDDFVVAEEPDDVSEDEDDDVVAEDVDCNGSAGIFGLFTVIGGEALVVAVGVLN